MGLKSVVCRLEHFSCCVRQNYEIVGELDNDVVRGEAANVAHMRIITYLHQMNSVTATRASATHRVSFSMQMARYRILCSRVRVGHIAATYTE